MRRLARIAVIVSVSLVILVAAAAAAFVWFASEVFAPPIATQVAAYPKVLKAWSSTGLVDHFPQTIPEHAADVSMIGYPGALQGSGMFQLRMKLPLQEVEAIEAQARLRAVRRCPPQCAGGVEDPEFWSIPRLEAGHREGGVRFPPDYVVYALEADGDWNHPTGRGIAVSASRNEVVYWAEQ